MPLVASVLDIGHILSPWGGHRTWETLAVTQRMRAAWSLSTGLWLLPFGVWILFLQLTNVENGPSFSFRPLETWGLWWNPAHQCIVSVRVSVSVRSFSPLPALAPLKLGNSPWDHPPTWHQLLNLRVLKSPSFSLVSREIHRISESRHTHRYSLIQWMIQIKSGKARGS